MIHFCRRFGQRIKNLFSGMVDKSGLNVPIYSGARKAMRNIFPQHVAKRGQNPPIYSEGSSASNSPGSPVMSGQRHWRHPAILDFSLRDEMFGSAAGVGIVKPRLYIETKR